MSPYDCWPRKNTLYRMAIFPYAIVLLLSILATYTHCTVYYITPESDTSIMCPSKVCLTLSEVAENSSFAFDPISTLLVFLQGDHYLHTSLHIDSFTTFRMSSYSRRKDVNIRCNNSLTHFEVKNVSQMNMSDLQFFGCQNSFTFIDKVLISSVTFSLSQISALVLSNISDAIIVQSAFNLNNGSKHLGLVRHAGGALIAHMSKIEIKQCNFTENNATYGGAMYIEENSTIIIINSLFKDNSVKCIAELECYGGALFLQNSEIIINESIFLNNSAEINGRILSYTYSNRNRGSHGGVIALNRSYALITQSIFAQNKANNTGGVFKVIRSRLISSLNNTFCHNRASDGAVMHGKISLFEDQTSKFINNTAGRGGVIMYSFGRAKFLKSVFIANTAIELGGVVHLWAGKLVINESKMYNNCAQGGGAIFGQGDAEVYAQTSNFHYNKAKAHGDAYGAVFYLHEARLLAITKSNFSHNFITSANGRGVVMYVITSSGHSPCSVLCINSRFLNNYVVDPIGSRDGGVIYGENVNVSVNECIFISNTAGRQGGVLLIEGGSKVELKDSKFCNNSATVGGVASLSFSHISVVQCTFERNIAAVGSVLFSSRNSTLVIQDVDIKNNIAEDAATVYLMDCVGLFLGYTKFANNTGSLTFYSSSIKFTNYIQIINNSVSNQTGLQEGGAITAFQSILEIFGECIIQKNSAKLSGALLMSESKIVVHGNLTIEKNTAGLKGGAMFLQQSELSCKTNSLIRLIGNEASKRGGGVYASASTIKLYFHEICDILSNVYYYSGSHLELLNNKAKEGGGLFLESNAKMYIFKEEIAILSVHLPPSVKNLPLVCNIHAISFAYNAADYGAAIYVDDGTYFSICDRRLLSTSTECFLQVLHTTVPTRDQSCITSYISFKNNTANVQGDTLYGGLLDRCTIIISPFVDIYHNPSWEEINKVSFFTDIYDSELSSAPVRVCFCKEGQPDCSYETAKIHIKKGELFSVSLVAVDDVNHTLPNVTIQAFLSSSSGGLGENQFRQVTSPSNVCTKLRFEVFSPNDYEELILYADGPCKDALLSQRKLQIQFSPCSCPVGFQPQLTQSTSCKCECDSKIKKFISDCNPKTGYLARKGNSWITQHFFPSNETIASATSYDYLTYANCPLDYCRSPDSIVTFNLNMQDGADTQCAHNHSGKLCGPCKSGLSLSLGSSHCVSCPKYWPALLVTLIAAFIIGGIVLIMILLTLNLTVAVGTLNGIIFYVNIVNANRSIFLPFNKPNVLSVFIAWINLDIGFDTCFIKGVDAYWKTLVQLVFPVYLIVLVLLIIIISERYTCFARLFERKNPVATLATVILLSYVKLLHMLIATCSFIVLSYPNGSFEVVWLPDATVPYLRGKHIVLFLISVIILLIGIGYTAILLCWQGLLRCKKNMIMRFVHNPKLYMFIETYNAPFVIQCRYWTGILLLARVILYIVSAVNVSRDPEVNVLAIAVVIISILLLKGYSNKTIYRKWLIDLLETLCYVNLLFFCLAKFFTLAKNYSGEMIAYVSTFFTMVLFVLVLAHHVYDEFLLKWIKRMRNKVFNRKQADNGEVEANLQCNLLSDYQNAMNLNEPTFSEVAAPTNSKGSTCTDTEGHAELDN